mmetsp:Transcript_72747/g.162859  ORF Transcript_72747/g.162859 Transcript_72747/m.162859 type:complete len:277 (-) Transcript_72747:238-1068(-)
MTSDRGCHALAARPSALDPIQGSFTDVGCSGPEDWTPALLWDEICQRIQGPGATKPTKGMTNEEMVYRLMGPGVAKPIEDMTNEELVGWLRCIEGLTRALGRLASIFEAETEGSKNQMKRMQSATEVPLEERTTLMLRSLPNDYTGDQLVELLDNKGLKQKYNFVYLPIDFKRGSGLGYAFVNLDTYADARHAMEELNGLREWKRNSQKVLSVDWGTDQGLQAHLNRYRNSPVMHKLVPENHKPMFFVNGERQAFPEPTKTIRAPRSKARGTRLGE